MRIHHATAKKAKSFGITLTIEDNEVVATKGGIRLAAGLQGNKVLEDAITKATGKPAKGAKKAVLPSTGKVVSVEERVARGEGWTKVRGGGFKHIETDDESEAADWAELCEEQGLIEPEPETEGADDDDDSDADQGKSIVKAKYRAKYKPTKDKCGDELSFQISEFITVEDDAGDKKISKKLLRAFAEANGCWVPAYGSFVSRTGDWNGGMARMNVANRLRAKIRQAKKAETEFKIVWPKV
jgi:hypothetical protein